MAGANPSASSTSNVAAAGLWRGCDMGWLLKLKREGVQIYFTWKVATTAFLNQAAITYSFKI
jgi:hypothetical protein